MERNMVDRHLQIPESSLHMYPKMANFEIRYGHLALLIAFPAIAIKEPAVIPERVGRDVFLANEAGDAIVLATESFVSTPSPFTRTDTQT